MLIIAELGEVERFTDARQVGAYAGLTARVTQSGEHTYTGHITRQGSPCFRWVLVQAAMKVVRKDRKLAAMYQRIRKWSSRHIARVRAVYDRIRQDNPERRKIALVATAHYLLRVMLTMLKTGEEWRADAA